MGAMLPEHVMSVCRWAKTADAERLGMMAAVVGAAMARLGLRTARRKAVKGIPAGSDHYDGGSLREWAEGVQPGDTDAVDQLLTIDATIRARQEG